MIDDYASELHGDDDMRMTGMDVPKSTLAVAVVLWGVLAGLGAWTLTMVADMRAEIRGQGELIKAVNARVDFVERQTQRNSDDIRELQRARK